MTYLARSSKSGHETHSIFFFFKLTGVESKYPKVSIVYEYRTYSTNPKKRVVMLSDSTYARRKNATVVLKIPIGIIK